MRRPLCLMTLAMLAMACEPEEVRPDLDSGDDGSSDCSGNVERIEGLTMSFTGLVRLENGSPAVGANVRLRDTAGVPPGDLATAVTGSDGSFSMVSDDITAFPGCWAVLSDYRVRASQGDLEGEIQVTKDIGEAWLRDEVAVPLEDKPIELR